MGKIEETVSESKERATKISNLKKREKNDRAYKIISEGLIYMQLEF